ncbi:starch binding domain-containing [Chlorella sorokiniana]|uniref:Starch binding domain-containing n=1 Tax=Chlorella sorokiniana TaxID=3076 RepID=A0A2P6U362_CHLSO|nr:starch binding domain-containing [Chlorella sorokiniana]|eukprot:PRW60748.1 starch binding domain-containing [Chlorella sorokiniana]
MSSNLIQRLQRLQRGFSAPCASEAAGNALFNEAQAFSKACSATQLREPAEVTRGLAALLQQFVTLNGMLPAPAGNRAAQAAQVDAACVAIRGCALLAERLPLGNSDAFRLASALQLVFSAGLEFLLLRFDEDLAVPFNLALLKVPAAFERSCEECLRRQGITETGTVATTLQSFIAVAISLLGWLSNSYTSAMQQAPGTQHAVLSVLLDRCLPLLSADCSAETLADPSHPHCGIAEFLPQAVGVPCLESELERRMGRRQGAAYIRQALQLVAALPLQPGAAEEMPGAFGEQHAAIKLMGGLSGCDDVLYNVMADLYSVTVHCPALLTDGLLVAMFGDVVVQLAPRLREYPSLVEPAADAAGKVPQLATAMARAGALRSLAAEAQRLERSGDFNGAAGLAGIAAATRSCAYLRCANLGGEGGPAIGQGVGSMRCSRGARRAVIVAQQEGEVPVTFRVHKKVKPGEHVRVVGQPRVLGEWDAGRAPKLQLVEPDADLWAGTVDGLVSGAPFPFKFIVLPDGTASARDTIWESIPDRTFQPGGEQTITASWDQEGFEAGPATAGTGGPRCHIETAARSDASAQVKARLDATIARLAAEGRAKQ